MFLNVVQKVQSLFKDYPMKVDKQNCFGKSRFFVACEVLEL
jgi:hypothetical protein